MKAGKVGEGAIMGAAELTVPFEMQSDPQERRSCGAACLSMVYRSFGKEIPQTDIWPAIAKENRFGGPASTTYLMTQDALNRGFSAVAIQARHPLHALHICRDSGIRAIMNHRLKHDSRAGHFTLLVDIDDKTVLLHDPLFGPSRRLSYAELLELWQPQFPDSEIVGNVLIGIAAQPPAVPACRICRTPILSKVECPRCKKPVGLQPAQLLGCLNYSCIVRMWNYICCPACDYLWSFGLEPQQAGAVAASSTATPAPPPRAEAVSRPAAGLDVKKLFGEVDKFCAHILAIPAAANHPDIKKQLDFITAGKEKFETAYAEHLASLAKAHAQLDALAKTAQEQQEAHRKQIEELNRPSPPLDGNALGRALLKNLGLSIEPSEQTTRQRCAHPPAPGSERAELLHGS
jgi:hypothetical protein